MASGEKTSKWQTGLWASMDGTSHISVVHGDGTTEMKNVIYLDYPDDAKTEFTSTWKFGEFGAAHPDIVAATGVQNYNLEMDSLYMKSYGVLNEDGTQIHLLSFTKKMEVKKFLTEDNLKKLKENREPAEAPTCSYFTPQPDKPGKMFWISGPPGAGKSTSAQLLARNNGYVYYEADCFGMTVNPFVDPNVEEPTLAIAKQTPLKGVSKEVVSALKSATEVWKQMEQGIFDKDAIEKECLPFYEVMGKDITKQFKRLGGNWAIAQVIFSRNQRDFLRKAIGPRLVFIILNVSKECQLKRVKARHGDAMAEAFMGIITGFSDLCEPAGEDEENAYNVYITEDMSPQDVNDSILDIVKKIG